MSPKNSRKKTSTSKTYLYAFGPKTEGDATQRALLGGKGANLAEMARIGLPVPPGFTLSTTACTAYYENRNALFKALDPQIRKAIAAIETYEGKTFGDASNPLLFSVRSGARESMPGMMDTILNLGLNDQTVKGLAEKSGNPRFAYDCYRRFIQMYGDVVMGVQPLSEEDHEPFEHLLNTFKEECGVIADADLSAEALKDLIHRYQQLIRQRIRLAHMPGLGRRKIPQELAGVGVTGPGGGGQIEPLGVPLHLGGLIANPVQRHVFQEKR